MATPPMKLIDANPYDSPQGMEQPSLTLRWLVAVVHGMAVASPVQVLAGDYGAWLLAWAVLGHQPRPSLDDPEQVLGVVYYVSAVPMLLLPCGVLLGLVSVGLSGMTHRRKSWAWVWAILLVCLWASVIGLLRWDPLHVGDWWMD